MRGVGVGSNHIQIQNRYIIITSVSLNTLLAHRRHTRETKRNYTLHTYHLPPAGVRPDSRSRDAVNWLSSPFNRLAETRRRYGWLRMVLTRFSSSEL